MNLPLLTDAHVQHIGWTLVQFLWQGTLTAVLFAGARALLGRRMPPPARYALACLTLAVMAVAPVLTFLVGPRMPATAAATGWPLPSPAAWGPVMPWLVAVWLAGVTGFTLRLIGGLRVTARLRCVQVRPAPDESQRLFDDLTRRLRLTRPVRLLVSSLVDVPTVIGWLRPVVLVPVGALTGLPPAHVTALLAHELAHVRRLDYPINILQSGVEALLFYHPAVWWVSDQIRAEREMCCDDVAVRAQGDVLTYARALAEFESCRRQQRGAALSANGMSLLDRIRRLLGHQPSTTHSLPTVTAAAGMALLCALGVAVAAHGASRSTPVPVLEIPVVFDVQMEVHAAPDTRALLSAVLLGPVGPSPVEQTAQPSTSTPRPTAPESGEAASRGAAPPEGKGSIRGRVLRSDTSAPLRKVRVSLRSQDRIPVPIPPTITDEQGRFELTGLPASRYLLSASKGGFVMPEEDRNGSVDPREGTIGRSITIADGERLDDLDLTLVPGGVIAGQVLDEVGEPLAGAAVHARPQQHHQGRLWPHPSAAASDVTDDLGRFRIFGLPPGGYFLSAALTNSPRYGPFVPSPTGLDATFYPGTSVATEAHVLHVQAGQELLGLSFALLPARGAMDSAPSARATVRPPSAPVTRSSPPQASEGTFTTSGSHASLIWSRSWGTAPAKSSTFKFSVGTTF